MGMPAILLGLEPYLPLRRAYLYQAYGAIR